jgi:hypothetical protein
VKLFLNRIKISLVYRWRYKSFKISVFFWNLVTKILISNKREMGERESLFIFSCVWGEKHINMFFEYGLPSLLMANNLPLLSKRKKINICFYTKDSDVTFIHKKMKQSSCKYNYSIKIESNFKDKSRDMMLNFFIHFLDKCIKNNALMLIAPADTIFSNGSISNMVELADGKGVSIAVAHPRVSIESLIKNNINIINLGADCPSMVDIAIKYGHDSLLQSDETNDDNSTYLGLATKQTPSGLAVIHNNPSPYLCSPIKDDLLFFKRSPSFNVIDKTWTSFLFRQSRLKIIGSSDIAFIIELTHNNDKKPDLKPGMKFNDKFEINYLFQPFANYSNTIVCLWRKNK